MVQSQIIHPNVQVNEITREFRNAASNLAPGKLVKDELFTLFEAVSALEIGDPKMDSGCTAFDPEGEEEFDPTRAMSAEQIIWLMDELLYREVAWHMGYPLSQTLFTSIHIERLLWPEPKRLSDARFWLDGSEIEGTPSLLRNVFQPYCVGLIKCCDLVLSMVTSQHYYEEEDFATQIFNRPLLHDFSEGEVMDLLQASRTWLHDSSNLPTHLKKALDIRVDVRSAFLQLFHDCASGERPNLLALEKSTALIKMIEDTVTFGRPTSAVAFTLKIQRRLASSVPPRPMIVIEKGKTFSFLRQLLTDTTTAFQTLDISSSSDLLVAYQNFMAQISQPAVYVRALLQSFLSVNECVLGRFAVKDFVTYDIRSLVLPSGSLSDGDMDELSEDQQIELASRIDLFVDRCGQSFLNLFRTLCLNRSRMRRTLCHATLEWDQIQTEAEDLDALAQSILNEQPIPYPAGEEPTFSYSFSSWVYHYKLIQLRTVLQMGFELSIYAPHEFADMYWYLSFLTSTHLNHLDRISFFVTSERRSNGSRQEEAQTTLKQLYRHFTWLKATEAMAKALHRVFTVLQRHGHLPKPAVAYASDALRYELRMRPFLHLTIPEPVSVDVAQQSSSLQGLSDELALDQASKLNQTARKAWDEVLKCGWNFKPLQPVDTISGVAQVGTSKPAESVVEREWTQYVRNSMKACIGTGIAITTLTKVLQGRKSTPGKDIASLKVEIPPVGERDRWHADWPVPKLLNSD